MIKFSLSCSRGHAFEAWFSGNDAFDEQKGRCLVECPTCGTTDVDKALMAPSVRTARTDVGGTRSKGASGPGLRAELERLYRETPDVGDRFVEECRRMDRGEAPTRRIIGNATPEQRRELATEGIDVHPIPPRPAPAH